MKHIKNKIIKLRNKINYHNYLYHILNISEIQDFEYDLLMNELNELEKKFPYLVTLNSPTHCVGEKPSNLFKLIHYKIPMLSLNNVFNNKDFLKFYKNIKNKLQIVENIELCCEVKIDGVAVSLFYKNGILIHGSTRGDGNFGENITSNVKIINSIPNKLIGNNIPKFLEVRGEVFINKENFIKLNNKILKNKGKIFSNARNAASGFLRQLKTSITIKKVLSFFCYGIGLIENNNKLYNQWNTLKQFKLWGLPVNDYKCLINYPKEVFDFYKKIEKKRSILEFYIDGIVIKVNSFFLQKKLGNNNRAYKWAIAYKFAAEEQITLIEDISFQVGRTGIITPVAHLKPIKILGVTISRATLHNINEIERLGICIGNKVLVKRAGDVIPKIVNLIQEKNNNNFSMVNIPKYCPSCNSLLHKYINTSILRCTQKNKCKAQKIAYLKHFVSKNAMNINKIGDKIIHQLVEKKYVTIPSDFFKLTENHLINLNRIGPKLAKNIINCLQNSKITTLSRFIYSLGINEVGETTAINLANYFGNIESIIKSTFEELLLIPNIGKIIAFNIREYINNKNNFNMIMCLVKILDIKLPNKRYSKTNSYYNYFINKNIVLTGTLLTMTRNEIKEILIRLGAQVKTCISKKTDLLIIGKSTGSKFKKAKELGISVMNEKQIIFLFKKNNIY